MQVDQLICTPLRAFLPRGPLLALLQSSSFSPNSRCRLVVSQRYESGMPQMIIRSPFHVFELANQNRREPATTFHLRRG